MIYIFVLFLFINIPTSYCEKLDGDEPEKLLPVPPDCGRSTMVQKRSYGSQPVNITHFPWMVALLYIEFFEEKISCGGSLINSRYVITAAHCIDDKLDKVVLGSTDYDQVQKTVEIEKTLIHSKFDEDENSHYFLQYDIGLIRLARNVQFTRSIYPICMPFQVDNYTPPTMKTTFILSGWGEKEIIQRNRILSMIELPFFDFEECKEIFSISRSFFNNKVLCAGGGIGKDACFGDSGSPLIRKIGNVWIIEGIVNGGIDNRCGTLNPGVYANVIKYERWIRDNVYHNLESGQNTMKVCNFAISLVILLASYTNYTL